jgi:hypothetical protein
MIPKLQSRYIAHVTIVPLVSSIVTEVKQNLKAFEGSILIQLLYFWKLSIALFLFETYDVSETAFCFRLLAKPVRK